MQKRAFCFALHLGIVDYNRQPFVGDLPLRPLRSKVVLQSLYPRRRIGPTVAQLLDTSGQLRTNLETQTAQAWGMSDINTRKQNKTHYSHRIRQKTGPFSK